MHFGPFPANHVTQLNLPYIDQSVDYNTLQAVYFRLVYNSSYSCTKSLIGPKQDLPPCPFLND